MRLRKLIKVSEETHRELSKLAGELRAINGKDKSFDDAIRYLLELRKRRGG
jgi:predicted CopG family antitoxin